MRRLLAPKKGRDLGFEPGIGRLAEKMLKKNIFRRNRNIGLELEDEMPIFALRGQQRLACPGNRRFDLRKLRVRRDSIFRYAIHIFHLGCLLVVDQFEFTLVIWSGQSTADGLRIMQLVLHLIFAWRNHGVFHWMAFEQNF